MSDFFKKDSLKNFLVSFYNTVEYLGGESLNQQAEEYAEELVDYFEKERNE